MTKQDVVLIANRAYVRMALRVLDHFEASGKQFRFASQVRILSQGLVQLEDALVDEIKEKLVAGK